MCQTFTPTGLVWEQKAHMHSLLRAHMEQADILMGEEAQQDMDLKSAFVPAIPRQPFLRLLFGDPKQSSRGVADNLREQDIAPHRKSRNLSQEFSAQCFSHKNGRWQTGTGSIQDSKAKLPGCFAQWIHHDSRDATRAELLPESTRAAHLQIEAWPSLARVRRVQVDAG